MDDHTLVLILAGLLFLLVSTLVGLVFGRLFGKRAVKWFEARKEGDWEFGEYGIIEQQSDGTFKTLGFEDLMAMKQDSQAAIEEFWRQQELRAYRLYGLSLMREQ